MENLIDLIRSLMNTRGWSEYRLAKEAHLPQSTISNIFHRNTLPSIPTLMIICSAFGIALSTFFLLLEQSEVCEQDTFLSKWNRLSKQQQEALESVADCFLSDTSGH